MFQSSIPLCVPDIVEQNRLLNDEEYRAGKTVLTSYPRAIFVQVDAPCNQDCLFCSRPEAYSNFNLDTFQDLFGSILEPVLLRAERINLTGSGELLSLPRAKDILGYFNRYAHTEKMFATNGSTLTPKMVDVILDSGNRYTIHVSLHSADSAIHQVMTASDTYAAVLNNLKYIRDQKASGRGRSLTLNFVFLLTTKNYQALPSFVRFASEYGADGVVVYYNYVYRFDQRSLSSFLIPEDANRVLDEAEEMVKQYPRSDGKLLYLSLPPRFRKSAYPPEQMCREAWSQFMLNPSGDIISCDVAGDSRENLCGKSFMDVWNGSYYTSIRRVLLDRKNACSEFCFRANPAAVNDFRSHIITRGKSPEEVRRYVEGK